MLSTILIVDDDEAIREVMAASLELEGYASVGARNGREAIDILIANQVRPSLILLDWMMPVLNGHEFLKLRQKSPALAEIPVIVISAFAGPNIEGLDVDFLPKPLELEALFSKIRARILPPAGTAHLAPHN